MNLDLMQNILVYLLIFLSILTFSITLRISKITKWTKSIIRQFFFLKQEISKLQKANNELLKKVDEKNQITTWLEEEEKNKELIKKQRHQRRTQKKQLIERLSDALPQQLDIKLGQNLLDKLGIITFLIGLALFINISMELNWINDYGRLFFGTVFTIIMLIAGYFLRKKFLKYSNILIGGGISAFIFTIFAAYFQYHIINLLVWLLIVTISIASTILISVKLKRQEIVLITFIAAYIAPFTVNFLKTDYLIIFSYITILNIAVLIYDFFQKSLLINLLSFGFTFITYGIWLFYVSYVQNADIPILGAFIFLTLFYIIFLVIVIINNVREGHEFKNIEFSIMMTAKAIYLSVGLMILNKAELDFQGLFAGLISIINYSFYLILYRIKNFDRRILNVFLSLAIMFLALIIPFEFYGKTLTIMWALQAAVLMFVAVRSQHEPMHLSSFLLTIGMFGSLFYDFYQHYFDTNVFFDISRPFFNLYFLGSLMVISSSVAIIVMLPKNKEFFVKKLIKTNVYRTILIVLLAITTYFSLYLEIKSYALMNLPSKNSIEVFMSVFNIGLLFLAAIVSIFKGLKPLAIVSLVATLIGFIAYVSYYSPYFVNLRFDYLMNSNIYPHFFNILYIPLFMLAIMAIVAIYRVNLISQKSLISFVLALLLSFVVVYFSSTILTNIVVFNNFLPNTLLNDLIKNTRTFDYSVLWAFVALLVLVIGFVNNCEQVRLSSIILLLFTLLKIIFYDYWSVSNQDMMISLSSVGLVMLLSSFLFYFFKNTNKAINQNI